VEGTQGDRAGTATDLQRGIGQRSGEPPGRIRRLALGPEIPAIAQSWRRNWEQVIPFFAFPAAVRRIIYTTNAIESLHSEVRKAVRGCGHFPSDEAATKLIWFALRNITAKWKNPPIQWLAAKAQFAIPFEDRFVMTRG
jgi:putative transposase